SVFVTHQLNIKAKNKIAKAIILKINKLNIEKFHECWIPDLNEKINLSGELSDNKNYKLICKKTGILSRFPVSENSSIKIKYDIVVIISGPEPQRSIFQKNIISELKEMNYKTLILTGKINFDTININKNITITNHLKTPDFQSVIKNTDIIISRAGYSSIMDLVSLKQTAILIPTPGQTEQEYLANYLHKNKLFYAVEQKKFNKYTIFTFNKYKPILKNNISEINNKTNLDTFFDEQFNL
ncbi:MAG: hypothetical protein JXR68_06100, partial [Bacteroidales bacterium]|nr:hypothetical protein [Bacteroidales bacterium]